MSFRVVLTERAARWWAENRSLAQAERWYDGFLEAINSLKENPERFAVAPESGRFPFEIRQINYGPRARSTHRAVFVVRAKSVVVLTVRHLAREDLAAEDLP